MTDTTNTERLVAALKDVLASIANKCPPCQGGLVHRCICLDCATERASAALAEAEGQAAAPTVVEPARWEGGEGWESLAWELCADENGEDACNELIWEGGAIPEPWGDRWMKYEGEAKRLIALVHKHAPCPPQQSAEPDWDSIREEAEHVTGLKVERNTYSIVVREVRKWLHSASMAQQSAEPVGVLRRGAGGAFGFALPDSLLPLYALQEGLHNLYTHPPQRKPEPPTDEQITEATKDIGLQAPNARWDIARAVLRLVGITEQGAQQHEID